MRKTYTLVEIHNGHEIYTDGKSFYVAWSVGSSSNSDISALRSQIDAAVAGGYA